MNKRLAAGISALSAAALLSVIAAGGATAAPGDHAEAEARSLDLTIAGNSVVTQTLTAVNDGEGETKNDASTIPNLTTVLPGTNLLGAGVAPQDATANDDGTSFACAGLAGEGSTGVVTTGDPDVPCTIDRGDPLTLGLGSLDLGPEILSSFSGALQPLVSALGPLLTPVGGAVDQIVDTLIGGLGSTPLGEIGLHLGLNGVEAVCAANPDAAQGTAKLADAGISLSLPAAGEITLVDLPVNPNPNQKVVTDLNGVVDEVRDALVTQLTNGLDGALAALADPIELVVRTIQDSLLDALLDALDPLLSALEEQVLDITLNKQVVGDNGRSIEVTAIEILLLPAAANVLGAEALLTGDIGWVSCGPNARAGITPTPTDPPTDGPTPPGDTPDVPTFIQSGVDNGNGNAGAILFGAAGLLAAAGTASLLAYRRSLLK